MSSAPWAAVAVTRRGRNTLDALREQGVAFDAWVPTRLADGTRYHGYGGSLSALVSEKFFDYRAWIFLLPVSAVVRIIAPLLVSKYTDPCVVAIDERPQYAVCLLSCHEGAGNDVTRRVAALLGVHAVVTTGSEVLNRFSLDLWERELRWVRGPSRDMTTLSRLIVEGEAVGVVQESGPVLWPHRMDFMPWIYPNWDRVPAQNLKTLRGWLWITHRSGPLPHHPGVIFYPPVLAVGIGVSRGTKATQIADVVDRVFSENQLALQSVAKVATIDIKKDEEGLTEFAAQRGWPIEYFSAPTLNDTPGVFSPSHVAVRRVTGAVAVAEPAAIRAARLGTLLVPKVKTDRVTVAVALQTTW